MRRDNEGIQCDHRGVRRQNQDGKVWGREGKGNFADFQNNLFYTFILKSTHMCYFAQSLIFWIKGIRSLHPFSIVAETNHHKFGDLKQ